MKSRNDEAGATLRLHTGAMGVLVLVLVLVLADMSAAASSNKATLAPEQRHG